MSSSIEDKCIKKGVRLTDQRKLIAKTMSESIDHPDVDELHKRVNTDNSLCPNRLPHIIFIKTTCVGLFVFDGPTIFVAVWMIIMNFIKH